MFAKGVARKKRNARCLPHPKSVHCPSLVCGFCRQAERAGEAAAAARAALTDGFSAALAINAGNSDALVSPVHVDQTMLKMRAMHVSSTFIKT